LLLELRVKDIGIIEEINWRLSGGLNVITGETGAGKSLVIDAVEALLAGKVDEEAIRHGATEAHIEGVFALPQNADIPRLSELLAENGLKNDEDTLIVNCDLRRQGRSVIRVNGQSVTKGLLQQIGRFLIDIHGQSEHLSLLDRKYHLDFLDAYAHTTDLRRSFTDNANGLSRAEQELKALAEEAQDLARQEEFLRFQIDEISRARLREGEEAELEQERNILAACEKLKTLSYEVYQSLATEDTSFSSVLGKLNEAVQTMKKLAEIDPSLKQQLDFLEETSFGLEETARDIRAYSDRLEYDPQRLEEVESRLELVRSLKRKYGQTITEILDYLQKAESSLAGLSHSTERRAELEQTCSALKKEMGQIGIELSRARSQAARRLAAEVQQELQELNMPQVEFDVAITQAQAEDGIPAPDGATYAFNNEGIDNVEFMAATNPGEPIKPLMKIASTGEISRFMLALKGALSQADSIPVLVFDEIDIGVGGRSGEIIGKKLWILARDRQVICVTHLPQIAAFGDAHYSVHKEVAGIRALSKLETLQDESRLKELGVMLGGPQYTATSLDNARELIEKAEAWKNTYRS
jgi:DNA repair protein RecN (Recombination protein N)